jgi:hypothetical protein
MIKTYEDYMNDPDILHEPMPLREIHAIRFLLQEKTEGMTPEERAAYVHAESQALFALYDMHPRLVESEPVRIIKD